MQLFNGCLSAKPNLLTETQSVSLGIVTYQISDQTAGLLTRLQFLNVIVISANVF